MTQRRPGVVCPPPFGSSNVFQSTCIEIWRAARATTRRPDREPTTTKSCINQRSEPGCLPALEERVRGGGSKHGNAIIIYKAGVKHVSVVFVCYGGRGHHSSEMAWRD